MPLYPFYLSVFESADQPPARPNASTPIGVIAFMIGVVALAVAWIPYLGMLAVPVAGAGVVLAIVGIVVGRAAGQRRVLLPLGAMFLCLISIAVSYGSTYAWQHRDGAPGVYQTTPAPRPIDMRSVKGPFVPMPTTQPTFVMPHFDRPTTLPTPSTDVER